MRWVTQVRVAAGYHEPLGVQMDLIIYGSINEGLELVRRNGKLFVRYDAGAHQIAWREDELTEEEGIELQKGTKQEQEVILTLQRRLEGIGQNPYEQNWNPK